MKAYLPKISQWKTFIPGATITYLQFIMYFVHIVRLTVCVTVLHTLSGLLGDDEVKVNIHLNILTAMYN